MPRLLELFCGTKSIGRAFEAAGWEVVSLDIVSKFEPTILCDIRSWDYALFPPGHFDMVWASPVCTEYSRALTMRPRRLEEGDALVLRDHGAFRPAHVGHRESGHRAAENPPFMERLPWVDVTYCKYGTPYRKQTRLWTNMRWRPSRELCRSGSRCDAWDGRHLRAVKLCEEIARAATAELADRLSIPD